MQPGRKVFDADPPIPIQVLSHPNVEIFVTFMLHKVMAFISCRATPGRITMFSEGGIRDQKRKQ
jgi:hypothetical protein